MQLSKRGKAQQEKGHRFTPKKKTFASGEARQLRASAQLVSFPLGRGAAGQPGPADPNAAPLLRRPAPATRPPRREGHESREGGESRARPAEVAVKRGQRMRRPFPYSKPWIPLPALDLGPPDCLSFVFVFLWMSRPSPKSHHSRPRVDSQRITEGSASRIFFGGGTLSCWFPYGFPGESKLGVVLAWV